VSRQILESQSGYISEEVKSVTKSLHRGLLRMPG
jgi:hypothetical protein